MSKKPGADELRDEHDFTPEQLRTGEHGKYAGRYPRPARSSRPTNQLQQGEIERFLTTGESDLLSSAWEGGVIEGGRRAKAAMLDALVAEVRRRSDHRAQTRVPESYAAS